MIEGMQNSSWMTHMDQILKLIGSEKAAEHFKVQINPVLYRKYETTKVCVDVSTLPHVLHVNPFVHVGSYVERKKVFCSL